VTTDQKRNPGKKNSDFTSIRTTCLQNRYKCTHGEAKSSKAF